MNLSIIVSALRKGAMVRNPTPLKWAGAVVTVAIVGLSIAQANGYLLEVDDAGITELVMAVLVLYSQIASTEKIGVLPAAPRNADELHSEQLPPSRDRENAENEYWSGDRGPFSTD